MSNWLGFSLSSHLRIDDEGGFGREESRTEQNSHSVVLDEGAARFSSPPMSVMPLRSDGSLCVLDPFRRSGGAEEWRYDGSMEATNPDGEGPKLEDFLGCYTSSPPHEHRVYCQPQQGEINVNQSQLSTCRPNTKLRSSEFHRRQNKEQW